jgi:ABC-type transporter lipoprotein component MlaA
MHKCNPKFALETYGQGIFHFNQAVDPFIFFPIANILGMEEGY